jgi:hypothetical protein
MNRGVVNRNDLYAYRTPHDLLDLRVLPGSQLRDIRDASVALGDLEIVAVIDTLLADEEPSYIAPNVLGQIRRRLGGDATADDVEHMKWLLVDSGHLHDGWLVITAERWDELASEIPVREEES